MDVSEAMRCHDGSVRLTKLSVLLALFPHNINVIADIDAILPELLLVQTFFRERFGIDSSKYVDWVPEKEVTTRTIVSLIISLSMVYYNTAMRHRQACG
jgi:hypothetical protein